MPEILMLLLFNSLYCLGFYLAMEEGMIGGRLGSWLNHHLGKAYESVAGCITCMASLHSWPYLAAFGFDWIYFIYVFALAGLNTSLYNKFIHD